MNNKEILSLVSNKVKLSKSECKLCLDAIIDVIKDALKQGETVTLFNFGKFKTNQIKSKLIYDFKTGEKRVVKEIKTPAFKASENLKQILK